MDKKVIKISQETFNILTPVPDSIESNVTLNNLIARKNGYLSKIKEFDELIAEAKKQGIVEKDDKDGQADNADSVPV